MADGTKKPIDQVEVGDKVVATDPETGEQVAKRVELVFVHDDTVVDLIVDGEAIATTDDHPFWSVTDQQFERADELSPGEQVLAADGRVITVSALRLDEVRETLAYNLSVEGIHTYHVGESEILVHNTCGPLTGAQSRQALDYLGVDTRRVVGRIEGREPVYQLPDGRVITRDLDGHVPSGAWKVAGRVEDLRLKRTREGTFGLNADGNLVQVGP